MKADYSKNPSNIAAMALYEKLFHSAPMSAVLTFDTIVTAFENARNAALDEAAQLADDIDSGKYTATKTVAQAIRALKEGVL